jgi:catechol 2,3-dioxygenase-like lactoylglutathione lyase family enzyme
MAISTQGLDHVALTVRDPAASERWYRDVLGLERVHADTWEDEPRMLMAGSSGLALFPAGDERGEGPASIRILHVAFRVDRKSFEAAQASLAEKGIGLRFADHEVAHSIYFQDPDGHRLELTTYEV